MTAVRTLHWTYRGRKYASEIRPDPCANCGKVAVVLLPPEMMAQQTDGTSHVCHPSLGGCNQGFAVTPPWIATRAAR